MKNSVILANTSVVDDTVADSSIETATSSHRCTPKKSVVLNSPVAISSTGNTKNLTSTDSGA
jgi:hypothetical protein